MKVKSTHSQKNKNWEHVLLEDLFNKKYWRILQAESKWHQMVIWIHTKNKTANKSNYVKL